MIKFNKSFLGYDSFGPADGFPYVTATSEFKAEFKQAVIILLY